VAVCAIVRAELLYGAARNQDPAKEHERVEVFLAPFVSFPFDDAAAEKYAEIRHNLERAGQRIGAHDLEIAAIVVARQLTLVTHNVSEFSRVSGLALEDWESVARTRPAIKPKWAARVRERRAIAPRRCSPLAHGEGGDEMTPRAQPESVLLRRAR